MKKLMLLLTLMTMLVTSVESAEYIAKDNFVVIDSKDSLASLYIFGKKKPIVGLFVRQKVYEDREDGTYILVTTDDGSEYSIEVTLAEENLYEITNDGGFVNLLMTNHEIKISILLADISKTIHPLFITHGFNNSFQRMK